MHHGHACLPAACHAHGHAACHHACLPAMSYNTQQDDGIIDDVIKGLQGTGSKRLVTCCSALGTAWAQQAPVRVPSSRSSRFSEPSGIVPLVTITSATCNLTLLLLVFKPAPVSAAIYWLLWCAVDGPRRLRLLSLQMLNEAVSTTSRLTGKVDSCELCKYLEAQQC